jgi:hypothetical protein
MVVDRVGPGDVESELALCLFDAALAHARGVKDTSRGGKYHNKREFVPLAGELGLTWPQGQRPHPVIGFSEVQLTEPTLADYADTLAYLGAAIRLYRDTFRRLGLLGGQGEGQEGQDGDGQQPTGKTGERSRSPAAASRPGRSGSGPSSTPPGRSPAGSAAKTSNFRTPCLTTSSTVENHPAGRKGQAAAWKRTRAWSARPATRSGPQHRRKRPQHAWQAPGRHHRHPVCDHLAPWDLGAVDNHDRQHHHARVGQDLGGLVGLERHGLQGRGEGVAAMPQPPRRVELQSTPILLGVNHEHPTGPDGQVVEVGPTTGDGQVMQDRPPVSFQLPEQPSSSPLPDCAPPPGDGVPAGSEPQPPARRHSRQTAEEQPQSERHG